MQLSKRFKRDIQEALKRATRTVGKAFQIRLVSGDTDWPVVTGISRNSFSARQTDKGFDLQNSATNRGFPYPVVVDAGRNRYKRRFLTRGYWNGWNQDFHVKLRIGTYEAARVRFP